MSCPLVAGRGVVGDVTGGEGKVEVGVEVEVEAAVCTVPDGRTRVPCGEAFPVGEAGSAEATTAALPVPAPRMVVPPAAALALAVAPAFAPALAPFALAD